MSESRSIEKLMEDIGRTVSFRSPSQREPIPCAECDDITTGHHICEKCRHKSIKRHAVLNSIPERYRWASLDEPLMATRIRGWSAIREQLESIDVGAQNIVLTGPAGSGKSSVLSALMNAHSERDVRWISAYKLAITRAHHDLGDESALERQAKSCRVLALDDLGNDRRTQLSAIDDVILDRYDSQRVMWVTTSLSGIEITKRYGDGIARRIFEQAVTIKILSKTSP